MIDAFLSNSNAVFGTVLLTCFGAFLVWHNNVKVRRAAACAVFRSAINTALEGLYPAPVNWPDNIVAIDAILRARFPAFQIAVSNFRPFVPWYRKGSFDRTWHRYRNAYDEDQSPQCYHHYANFDDNPNPKEVFKSNVDHLLSFANET